MARVVINETIEDADLHILGELAIVRREARERRAWAWIWFGCCWIVVAVWAGSALLKAVRP